MVKVTSVRLLYLTAEACPTFRADVAALFGKWLPRFGVLSDVVAARTSQVGDAAVHWEGGRAMLCNAGSGRVLRHLRLFVHTLRCTLKASPAEYSAIQVRDMPLHAAIALIVARLRGLPMYYWMSYPMPEGHLGRARSYGLSRGPLAFLWPWLRGVVGYVLLYWFVLRRADHVFVTSDRMKEDVLRLGIRPEKVTPLPMGVDLDALRPHEIEPVDDARLRGRIVLVYLGTLDAPRRIDILFDMLRLVRQERPDAILLLVGGTRDSEHLTRLRATARAVGVADHVIWTGWLPTAEAWRYVRRGDVALSPFPRGDLLDSASPTKVPEYLALGLPVVCNDNPDQQALITECGCGVCTPYDSESFAAAVLELLRMSPADRDDRVARGRAMVAARRSYEVLAAQLAGVYRTLSDPAEGARR